MDVKRLCNIAFPYALVLFIITILFVGFVVLTMPRGDFSEPME